MNEKIIHSPAIKEALKEFFNGKLPKTVCSEKYTAEFTELFCEFLASNHWTIVSI